MSDKTRTYYELITIIGAVTTYITWNLWNETLIIGAQGDFIQALPALVGLFVGISILVTLLGLTGVLLPSRNVLFVIFGVWSLPLLQHNEMFLVGFLWMILYFGACLGVTWAIHNQIQLFIKPVLIKVIPGQIKIWFFMLTIILSGSLILHPAVQEANLTIQIPDNVWNNIWNLIDIDFQTGPGSDQQVQGVVGLYNEVSQTQAQGALNDGISIERLQELLQEYGLFNNETNESGSEGQTVQSPSEYLSGLESDLSQGVKEGTEQIANDFIDPIRNYLPYVIGISFFISAQIITPILGYLGLLLVEGFLRLLLKLDVIQMEEEEKLVKQYALD